MKRTKLTATLVLVIVLAACMALLSACTIVHTHTYSTEWQNDANGHWHVATCNDLKEGDELYKKDYAEHVWGDDDECDVCHYKKAPAIVEYTITLDANGGMFDGEKETLTVETKDGKIETYPVLTAPEGTEFVGWFTEDFGGEEVNTETVFTKDATVYAQYVYVYTITLDAGDGTVESASLAAKDGKLASLPTPTAPNGKQFIGWFTEKDGGTEVTLDSVFDEDATIYARYASVYTVTLNVGTQGTLPEGSLTTLTTKNGKLEVLPTPETANALVFVGWFTEKDGGTEVTLETLFEGEVYELTIYAQYRQELSVNFVVGEGSFPEGTNTTLITEKNRIKELPTPTAPENKWFKGWFTQVDNGVIIYGTSDLSAYANTNYEVTLYALYAENATVTLNVGGAGTLPEGSVLTYQTQNGKIVLPEGQRGLPAVSTGLDHYVFFGWYNGSTRVDVETTVFEKSVTLTAKTGREDGVWIGEKFINPLTRNNAASRHEYWLGGNKIILKKGDVISLYMNGVNVRHYVEQSSAGIDKPGESTQVTSVAVSVAGEFEIYLHLNANDWSCQYAGPTEITAATEIPAGCDAVTVKIGANEPITFFLVDGNGNGIGKDNFSKYCIYTFQDEIFGNWSSSTTNGKLKEEMVVNKTSVPAGWIFRWGSGYGQQTSDIKNAFKAGKAYIVKLPKQNKGKHEVSELSLSSVYTITLDQNYEEQPTEKKTVKAYNGKLTTIPTFVRVGYEDKDLFWYTEKEGGERITKNTVFTADTTIYAHWRLPFKVTFNLNYEGCADPFVVTAVIVANQTYSRIPSADFPASPSREGYAFMGWYNTAATLGGTRITTSTNITADTVAYARWRLPYKVTFDYNYEGGPESVVVEIALDTNKLDPAKIPADPVREGYEFMGWYNKQLEGGVEVSQISAYMGDTTLYAHWQVPVTVTFDLNYEGQPAEMLTMKTVGRGKIAGFPESPVREGYVFLGWFTQPGSLNSLGVYTYSVYTEDTTIYAKWKESATVTFDLNYEGQPAEKITAKTGNGNFILSFPEAPVREGYTFAGWYTLAEEGEEVTSKTKFPKDATVYARWTANDLTA